MTEEYGTWLVPRVGDWVMTKTKKIGVIGFLDTSISGNMYLYFSDGGGRSYKMESLTLLDKPMQKLLTSANEQFYKDLPF
jgi:hypothetical protein